MRTSHHAISDIIRTVGPGGPFARLDHPAHRALAAVVRAMSQFRHRRAERAQARMLGALDQRTLKDIGLDRSEIGSLAAELHGTADRTRLERGPFVSPLC